MSGHSHWAGIKHKKELLDKKKSKIFSKISREIIVAVRESGPNPETNNKLRVIIEKAKKLNFPKEQIERAIKRASGKEKEGDLNEFYLEAILPSKVSLIIEGITDNKNRTISEIKNILQKYGGKIVPDGTVKWLFERFGTITIDYKKNQKFSNKEELELQVISAGAQDISWQEDILTVYTKPDEVSLVRENLEKNGINIESFSLEWVAKNDINVEKEEREKIKNLLEELDDLEDVQDIYININLEN